jgi:hypothetical protein
MAGRIVTANKGPVKLPIVGKIRVGEKRANGNGVEYPVSLDYFKAVGDYSTKFHDTFGEKPTTFGIVFISDDPAQSCNERYELRDKKTGDLLGSGDGVNFKIFNPDNKEYEDFIADSEEQKKKLADYTKTFANGSQWSVILTIEFVIPKISTVMGLWKLETKGVLSSIPNIRDTFDEVQKQAGTVVNIPFDLQIKKVKSQRPGDKRLYPVVALIPNVGADKIDEVNQFLQQGNNLKDIKRFLQGDNQPEPKTIESRKTIQIEQNSQTIKAELFEKQ